MCGFKRSNDDFGTRMFLLSRLSAISLIDSICPRFAVVIMSRRCLPLLLKQEHKNCKCYLSFDSRVLLFLTPLDAVLVSERNTILPLR